MQTASKWTKVTYRDVLTDYVDAQMRPHNTNWPNDWRTWQVKKTKEEALVYERLREMKKKRWN